LSSSSSSTNAVIVRHRRHCSHHGVVVAWSRLPPPSSSPSSSTLTQPHQQRRPRRLNLSSSPPCNPPPPLTPRSLRLLDRPWRRHGLACGIDALPPGPTRQVPLPHMPPSSGYGPIAPAPPSQPPQCLGLLSGGRRCVDPPLLLGPPPPVGRRLLQHGDVDGRTWQPGTATTTP
jgi:hypothetical protein